MNKNDKEKSINSFYYSMIENDPISSTNNLLVLLRIIIEFGVCSSKFLYRTKSNIIVKGYNLGQCIYQSLLSRTF